MQRRGVVSDLVFCRDLSRTSSGGSNHMLHCMNGGRFEEK